MSEIDISKDLTPEFYKQAKKGQVLTFREGATLTHLKITRLNKSKRICLVERMNDYLTMGEAEERYNFKWE